MGYNHLPSEKIILNLNLNLNLNWTMPLASFYTHWEHQMLSGGIERD